MAGTLVPLTSQMARAQAALYADMKGRAEAAEGLVRELLAALTEIARLRTNLSGDFSMASKQSDIARSAIAKAASLASIGGRQGMEREPIIDRSTGKAVPGPWTEELINDAGLHHATAALVNGFAFALAQKLRAAEIKYGFGNGWLTEEWEAECRAHLYEHATKGDPLDVAAYAAFMWRRGWSTAPSPSSDRGGE